MMGNDTGNFDLLELDQIKRLLEQALANQQVILDTVDQQSIKAQLQMCIVELKRAISIGVLACQSDERVYIGRVQQELAIRSDQCALILTNPEHSAKVKADVVLIAEYINLLLEYVLEDFNGFLNLQFKVPKLFKTYVDQNLSNDWQLFFIAIEKAGNDQELIDIFHAYQLEMSECVNLSFAQLLYHKELLIALLEIDQTKSLNDNNTLISSFCYLNFNYYPLLYYYIRQMQRDYNKVESYREEFIELTILLRTFNQYVVKPNYGHDLQVEGFRDVLVNVIEKEISCVKKLLHMNVKALGNSGAKFLLQQFYFRISISMEQFLFLFRLLIDKGIVLVNRKADLYEFIHSHVGTLKKDHLSIGNMQNTYGENNRMTAIRVRALLQSLITHIDQKYL